MRGKDRYSRMVAILKVMLPLCALALLSTLFLLSRSQDPVSTIPFVGEDLTERLKGQQVTGPTYSGTNADGDEIDLSAQIVTPETADTPASAKGITGRISFVDGGAIYVQSDQGAFQKDRDNVTLSGNVRLLSTSGYEIVTDEITSSIDGNTASTPGQVDGTGPFGAFTAGQMVLKRDPEDGHAHMIFKNGVKLIYRPEKK